MSENKSKLPDLNEIAGAATKLFRDIGKSAKEIYQDYKSKREACEDTPEEKKTKAKKAAKSKSKDEAEE